jgi:hypothetical protein
MTAARLEGLAAHADKDLLVDRDILRIEMPVTVGHAGLVEGERLRRRRPGGEGRREQ